MLAATAVVSALAIVVTAPAHAMYTNDGGGTGSIPTPTVGTPADGALKQESTTSPAGGKLVTPVEASKVASGGADGFDTAMVLAIAGGVVAALGAGTLLVVTRHRRTALP